MAHKHRTPAPFGGERFAQVVHDVGVDIGQIAQGQQRIVLTGQSTLFARRPLQGAVRTHMHHGVCTQLCAQPQVGGQIVVAQWHAGAVANAFFTQLGRRTRCHFMAQRLRHDNDIAQQHAGNNEAWLASLTTLRR